MILALDIGGRICKYSIASRIRTIARHRELTDAQTLDLRLANGCRRSPWGGLGFTVVDTYGTVIYFG